MTVIERAAVIFKKAGGDKKAAQRTEGDNPKTIRDLWKESTDRKLPKKILFKALADVRAIMAARPEELSDNEARQWAEDHFKDFWAADHSKRGLSVEEIKKEILLYHPELKGGNYDLDQ